MDFNRKSINGNILVMKKYMIRMGNRLLHFLHLQLFLSLISLPILIAWGLPFSWLTFVGNLIFTPFLTLFLLVSSLIFFAHLVSIPCGFLVSILEKITSWWIFLMQWSDRHWLMGFARPSLMVLFCIPVIAVLIVQSKRLRNPVAALGVFCRAAD